MATTNNKHLAYRYGYCVNEKCDKSKKDTKGKPQILQVASHKQFVCPDCQKPLHECPPPPPPKNILKWIIIVLLTLLVLGGAGFGIYKLIGSKRPMAIKLAQKELVMKVGETQVIVPTAEPEGVKATFIFKKKGKNVEVTSGGEVTALKKGEATILVKCEENPDIRALCKIKVEDGEGPGPDTIPTPKKIMVEQLSIDGGDFSIKVGESKQLSYIVTPEKHDEILSWTSDNESVATVDNTGKVSAVKEGTANIKIVADKSGVNTSVKLTVTKKPGGGGGNSTYVTNANIGYGTYTGDVKPGTTTPHGHGTITYKTKRKVVSWKDIEAQPGDKYEGDFRDGAINGGGYLKTRDGNVIRID